MAKIILVCGGSRSGKSQHAQEIAESLTGSKLFLATCPRIDSEIDDRIEKHIEDRLGKGWKTIEEELELAEVLNNNSTSDIILADCLTLWINNLLYDSVKKNRSFHEEDVETLCEQVLLVSRSHPGTIIFVTNEVGSGIVPESAETRLYRDLVGRCNQCIAGGADEVILVSCGIPLVLKTVI